MIDRDHIPIIAAFIEQLCDRSDTFAALAGVGGVETAGHLISYLAEHPKDLEPFLVGGFMELPDRWIEHGELTFHGIDGKVRHARDARYSRIIDRLKTERPLP